MADMSKKTDEELEKIMYKDSGYDAKTARAAYKELTKRKGDLGFTVTMILGGRALEHPKAPPPKPKNKSKKPEMAYGGMAKGKKHMYVAGGSVTENPGLKALKASGPKGMEAYNKITGK
jgi:hypothetical protein